MRPRRDKKPVGSFSVGQMNRSKLTLPVICCCLKAPYLLEMLPQMVALSRRNLLLRFLRMALASAE